MSKIEDGVVTMKFDNAKFESGVRQTLGTLTNLKSSLKQMNGADAMKGLASSAKSVKMDGLAQSADLVKNRFSAMQVAGVAALATIASKATSAGINMIKSLTLDPVMDGFREYELKMGSIQTILANTAKHGTKLPEVSKELNELNKYSDKTIYNFADMTRNVGLFTNSGMKLNDAVQVIKGFSNEAAASGTNAQQAAGAAYQLSQALSAGKVQLMDWRSLQNVGMGNANMKQGLIDIATAMGTLKNGSKAAQKVQTDFNGSLQEGWLTADVMTKYLGIMATDYAEMSDKEIAANKAKLKGIGLTDQQIDRMVKQQKTAQEAAQMVRTASQLFGTMKEAVGSVWSQVFETLIGDFNDATTLFTSISDKVGAGIQSFGDKLNNGLKAWVAAGGRTATIQGFVNIFKALGNIIKPIGQAFSDIFKPLSGSNMAGISKGFESFTRRLEEMTRGGEGIRKTFQGIFAVFHLLGTVLGGVGKLAIGVFGGILLGSVKMVGVLSKATGTIGGFIAYIEQGITSGAFYKAAMDRLAPAISKVHNWLQQLNKLLPSQTDVMNAGRSALNTLSSEYDRAVGFITPYVQKTKELASELRGDASSAYDSLVTKLREAHTAMQPAISKAQELATAFRGDAKQAIRETGEELKKLVDYLKSLSGSMKDKGMTAFNDAMEKARPAMDRLRDSAKGMNDEIGDTSALSTARAGIGEYKDEVGGAFRAIGSVVKAAATGIWAGLKAIAPYIGTFASYLDGVGHNLAQLFRDITKDFDPIDYQGFFNLTALTAAALAVFRFTNSISGVFDGLADSLNESGKAITGVLGNTSKALKSMAFKNNATGILMLAGALLVLAGALWIMSKVDTGSLGTSLTAMSALVAMIGVLGLAVSKMGDGLAGGGKMVMMAAGLVILSVGILALAKALEKINQLNPDQLTKSLVGLGVLMTEIGVFMAVLGKVDGKNALANSLALILIAIALSKFTSIIKEFAAMDWGTLVKGMGTLAVGLGIMAGAMRLMPPDAAALGISMAVALMAITLAVKMIGALPVENILKGVAAIAAVVFMITTMGMAMAAVGPGLGPALLGVSLALMSIAVALSMLGQLSLTEIGIGLLAIFGALAIVAGFMAVLSLIGPALMVVGTALLMMGGAMLLAGVGITAFANGFVILVALLAGSSAVILGFIAALIAMLPMLGTAMAKMIANAIQTLLNSVPGWVSALGIIIRALLSLLIGLAPQFGVVIVRYGTVMLAALRALGPQLVETVLSLIEDMLEGMRGRVGEFTRLGLDIVTKLLNALADGIGPLADAAVNLIVAAIDALASAISSNGPRLQDAMMNLGRSMITAVTGGLDPAAAVARALSAGAEIASGIATGIRNGVGAVMDEARRLASAAADTIRSALKINSPSKVTMKYGQSIDEGLILGMRKDGIKVAKEGTKVANNTTKAIAKALAKGEGVLTPTLRAKVEPAPKLSKGGPVRVLTPVDNQLTRRLAGGIINTAIAEEHKFTKLAQLPKMADNKPILNYTQINNSPKALSAVEIYRNTKLQLIMSGGSTNVQGSYRDQ